MAKKNLAPFGSSVKRFGKNTLHPNLDPSGLYAIRSQGCDPCLYHPKPINEIFQVNKNRKDTNPWLCKKQLEEWAQNLGYRNQKVLEYRKWHRSLLGPAWHEVTEPKPYEATCKNVGFGRAPRFRHKRSGSGTPGPGTYYKSKSFKVTYGCHSNRPTFEREDPCRFRDMTPNWSLAPNRYTIIDKDSIEQKPKKIVSLRGPYELFSGKRDASSIKNHFGTSQRCSAKTWPIALKGTLDKYTKSRFGVMNKTGREHPHRGRSALVDVAMCVRRAEEPGPGHYEAEAARVWRQNYHPFNSSYDKPPGYQRSVVWPGVGRYNSLPVSCGLPGHGHRHVFLSKEQRTIGAHIPQPMNSF